MLLKQPDEQVDPSQLRQYCQRWKNELTGCCHPPYAGQYPQRALCKVQMSACVSPGIEPGNSNTRSYQATYAATQGMVSSLIIAVLLFFCK